jgi:hypothetical protein
MIEITGEAATTIRFQILFGVGMLGISMLAFFIISQVWTMDLKYIVLAIGALVAIGYLRDALMMLADVAIVIMKARGK